MPERPVLDPTSYRKIVVITGPGLSRRAGAGALSGARRDGRDGRRAIHPSTIEGFRADPANSWQYWRSKREQARISRPGPGHEALAHAERLGREPGSLVLVTHATDGLHLEAGSLNVIELAGNLHRTRCSSPACGLVPFEDRSTEGQFLPTCPLCGAPLRPDLVMAGERVPAETATRVLSALVGCELFVAVASSGLVYPVAKYLGHAKHGGARTVFVNRESILEFDPASDFDEEYLGEESELLPRLFGLSATGEGGGSVSSPDLGVATAEELVDPEAPLDLEDLDASLARDAWLRARADMLSTGRWYEARGLYKGERIGNQVPDYLPVSGRRLLALGRSDRYVPFIRRMTREGGEQYYQSDFMAWIDPGDAYTSLLWYLRSAERIDFSLEGISAVDLRAATSASAGPARSRRELGIRFMTSWEMNQIWWGPELAKTWWHLMGSMGVDQAFRALGGRVARDRLIDDELGPAQ